MIASLEVRLVGAKVGCVTPERRGLRGKPDLESRGDGLRDLILHREDVRHLAVVALRPEMKTIGDLDELRRDSDAVARLANTPLENMLDVEPPADLSEFDVLSPEEEGGRAAGDLHAGYVGQHIDDLLGQTVAEILVLLVRAHVGERQYGDGRLALGPVSRRSVGACSSAARSSPIV